MNLCISDHPLRLELQLFRPVGGATAIVHSSEQQTYRYLKAHVRQPSAMAALRQLLAQRGARHLASDDDVLHDAAAKIMMQRLFLIHPERAPAGITVADDGAPPAEADKRPAVRPPAPLPPPRTRQAAQVAQAAQGADAAPEPELTALLAQDVQAASMEQAAQHGTPFCAVCERERERARNAARGAV